MIKNTSNQFKPLTHTSFWLQPWALNYIRFLARRSRMSQSLVLYVIILDFYLKKVPLPERSSPEFRRCRKFADAWLPFLQ